MRRFAIEIREEICGAHRASERAEAISSEFHRAAAALGQVQRHTLEEDLAKCTSLNSHSQHSSYRDGKNRLVFFRKTRSFSLKLKIKLFFQSLLLRKSRILV